MECGKFSKPLERTRIQSLTSTTSGSVEVCPATMMTMKCKWPRGCFEEDWLLKNFPHSGKNQLAVRDSEDFTEVGFFDWASWIPCQLCQPWYPGSLENMHSPLRNVWRVFRLYQRAIWEITSVDYQSFKGYRQEDKKGEIRGLEGENKTKIEERIIEQKKRCKSKNSKKGDGDLSIYHGLTNQLSSYH